MAWLSPAYPVGAFSYSSGIEWAVESGDIKDADNAASAGSTVMIARGRRASATRCSSCTRIARSKRTTTRRCARSPSLRPRSRRRRSAIWKRPRRAAPSSRRRAPPGRARRSTGWPRSGTAPVAYPVAVGVAAAGHGVALEPALGAYLHAVDGEPDLGRRAAHSARARPTGSACSRRSSRSSPQPPRARSRRRSTRSAARHSAPISPACTTRPSTRGCSVRDMRRA